MASHLTGSEFQIGTTQTINGVSTSVNNSASEVPTSKAVRDFIDNVITPISLTVSGNWTNTQGTLQPVDTTGLTFIVTYKGGTTASVTPSIRPLVWSNTIGTQTATFYYTEHGVTVSASKSASVVDYRLITPLTLQAREAGNVSITKTGDPGTIYYSKNGGSQIVLDSEVNISVVAGDKVSFYRTLSEDLGSNKYFKINCTNNCYVYGNIMSLYNKDNFSNLTTIGYQFAFYYLFNQNSHIDIDESVGKLLLPATTLANYCYYGIFNKCSSLTSAPALPATTLAQGCYANLFNGCTSLTTAPTLPATTLTVSCYSNMFYGCTSLTSAPALPATTVSGSSYSYMFYGCTSLTTAPTLPATTLGNKCYQSMFDGCTSLTSAPALPATTLDTSCYQTMFQDCISLTTAPTLPATTLIAYCYAAMFRRCTNLTSITCLATNISANKCITSWVNSVASSGTFTTPSSTSWTTGENGIPSGWTRVNS